MPTVLLPSPRLLPLPPPRLLLLPLLRHRRPRPLPRHLLIEVPLPLPTPLLLPTAPPSLLLLHRRQSWQDRGAIMAHLS